jgi:hypothetical protein
MPNPSTLTDQKETYCDVVHRWLDKSYNVLFVPDTSLDKNNNAFLILL